MDYINILEKFFRKEEVHYSILENVIFSLKGLTNKNIEILISIAKIPPGKTISYSEFAKISGFEKQIRSVATIIGKNPIPVIIPCHRIIRKSGEYGEYLLGRDIKKELIEFETKDLDFISERTMKIIKDFFRNKKQIY